MYFKPLMSMYTISSQFHVVYEYQWNVILHYVMQFGQLQCVKDLLDIMMKNGDMASHTYKVISEYHFSFA
jgi:hypothetical protein